MYKIKFIVVILFLSFFFQSCDPAQILSFNSNRTDPSTVTIVLDSNVNNSYLEDLAIGDSVTLVLKADSFKTIEFGTGTWSKKEVTKVAKSIKNIHIKTEKIDETYNSKSDIEQLLEKNRKGVIGNKIIVEIN